MVAATKPAAPPTPLHFVKNSWVPDHLRAEFALWTPRSGFGLGFLRLMRQMEREGVIPDADAVGDILVGIWRSLVIETELQVKVIRHRTSHLRVGRELIEDHGVTSRKVITNAGVGFIVDAWQNLLELETMKYHGLGTATTAEAATQTALTTEITTAYNPDNTRATGTTTENAANIFETVATNTVDGASVIEEHGLFSQAATGGGTMFDRSLTGTQTLGISDALQSTHRTTFTSGG
jgi:hypothetical protein